MYTNQSCTLEARAVKFCPNPLWSKVWRHISKVKTISQCVPLSYKIGCELFSMYIRPIEVFKMCKILIFSKNFDQFPTPRKVHSYIIILISDLQTRPNFELNRLFPTCYLQFRTIHLLRYLTANKWYFVQHYLSSCRILPRKINECYVCNDVF